MTAVCLVLAPVHLLEPRYFTVPLFVTLLEMLPLGGGERMWLLVAQIVGFIIVNIITFYVFLYRPYTWVDGSVARFMY